MQSGALSAHWFASSIQPRGGRAPPPHGFIAEALESNCHADCYILIQWIHNVSQHRANF